MVEKTPSSFRVKDKKTGEVISLAECFNKLRGDVVIQGNRKRVQPKKTRHLQNGRRYKNDSAPWTDEDIEKLIKLRKKGLSHVKISQKMKRTKGAIQSILATLNKES